MKDKLALSKTNAQLLDELELLRFKLAEANDKLAQKLNPASRKSQPPIHIDAPEPSNLLQSSNAPFSNTAPKNSGELEAVFESMADPILILSPENNITSANSSAVNIMGFNPQNMNIYEIVKNLNVLIEGPLKDVPVLDEVLCGKKFQNVPFDISFGNQEKRSLLLSANPIFLKNSISGVVVTWHDITERVRMADAIRESEERYRIMGETIPFGIWLCNKNGGLQYASPSFLELIKMDLSEASEFGWTKRMVAEDVSPMLNRWLESIKTGEEWEAENRFVGDNGKTYTILSRGRPVRDRNGEITSWVGINLDITERKEMEQDLQKIEWLLTKGCCHAKSFSDWVQPYGDLSEINTSGEIINAVGKNLLIDVVRDSLDLLETSAVVIELNGSFALSECRSEWCRYLDLASRKLCGDVTNGEALKSGKWLCRDSCWQNSAKMAIETGKPVDNECAGGIRIYAVPIKAGKENIGVVSLGYGDPPTNPRKLKKIAAKYHIEDYHKLNELAKSYESRPPFIIDTAKSWLHSSGRMIGAIVERKRAEIALQKAYSEIEKRVEARTAALTRSYNLLKEETRVRIKAEEESSKRYDALESVYAMATAFSVSLEATIDQVVLSISTILKTPMVALGRIEKNEFHNIAQVYKRNLVHLSSLLIERHPCGIASREQRSFQITGRLDSIYPVFMKGFEVMKAYMGIPILNSKGIVLGTICVLDNVERVFSEYEIHLIEIFARYIGHEIDRKNMERQLLQSQEMKMLGQLTSGVAHEVRNPLNGIMAITDALSKDLGENTEYRTFIEHIRKQVIRLSDLMRDLLDLGRPIESANLMPTSVVWLVSAAINMWQHSSYHQQCIVRTQSSKAVEPVTVFIDRAKMEQVLINLLENACAHSKAENEIVIDFDCKDGIVAIKVIDQGTGIKPEYFEHLFEPFFTTRKGGTGLGLGIVKRIVESHGGAIDIRNNEPPPGVTAVIKLPVVGTGI